MEHLTTAKKHFSAIGLGIFTYLLTGTVFQILVIALMEVLLPGWGEHPWGMWLATFAPIYLVATPIALLIIGKAPAVPLKKRSLKPTKVLAIAVMCVFLMYAGNAMGTFLTTMLQSLLGVSAGNPILSYTLDTAFVPKFLFMVILAPLIEEYVFRKQLIDRMHNYGEKTAVITSALMFGLFHGNLSQLFYAFLLGLVFGYVYLRTGKLRYSIGLHMFINCLGSVIAPLFVEKLAILESIDVMDAAALEPHITWIIALLVYVVLLIGSAIAGLVLFCNNLNKSTFKQAEAELPKGTRIKTAYLNPGMLLCLLSCTALILLNTLLA